MKSSFTESIEAVTHDSDPKYLRFQRISDDPTKQAGEGVVVERIGTELALNTLESGDVPAVTGPRVGDLTGGSGVSSSHPVKLQNLLAGNTDITIGFLSGSPASITKNVTAASLKALAIAQGLGGTYSGMLEISSLFSAPELLSFSGATIDSVTHGLAATLFTADNDTITSFSAQLAVADSTGASPAFVGGTINMQTPGGNGPGLGFVCPTDASGDRIYLYLTINSPPISAPNSVTLQLQPPVHNDDLTQTLPGGTAVFNDLTGGEITIHLLFTDLTTQDVVITAAELKACAIAQGYGAMSTNFINLLPTWYTLPAGKVIATATMTTTTAFATSGGLNATASYYLYLAINNPASSIVIAGTAHMNLGATVTESPGAYTIQPGDYLGISVTLTGGAVPCGLLGVSFTLDDSSVIGPFAVSADELKTLADAHGHGGDTVSLVNSNDLSWDLSPLIGHSVVSARFNVTRPFSSVGYLLGPASNINVESGFVMAGTVNIQTLTDTTVGFSAGPYTTAPVFAIRSAWFSDPSTYVDLLCALDAASIVAAANPGQRLARSTVVDMYNSDLYPTYDGWTMGGLFASSMTANYTSSHSPTIQEPSLFTIGFSSSGAGAPFSDVDPLNVAGTWSPGTVQRPIAADARLQVGINLFPVDVPASFGGNILTEPYEVRLRNLSAFKFHVYGPGTNQDTPGPTFDVVMFVSQGSPEKGDNSLREWAALPINWTNTLGPGFVDNAMASISVDEHFPNMPDNFGGALVFPAYNNNHGPFNYIRFLITPSEGKHNVDYVNMFLTITANAREIS